MNPDALKAALLAALGFSPATDAPLQPAHHANPLRSALTPPARDPMGKIDQLIHSPYADSVASVTGRPSAMVAGFRDQINPDLLGEYAGRPGADTIFLSPTGKAVGQPVYANGARQQQQPEYTLAHELAHRLDAASPGLRAQQDSVYDHAAPPRHETYWQKNKTEHFADAFATAITALRATAGQVGDHDAPARSEALLQQAEQRVPGARLLVAQLLQHPTYANHPLRQAMQAQPAPRDATAVRLP